MLISILLSIPIVTLIATLMLSGSTVRTLRILNFGSSGITLVYSLFFILGLQIKNSVLLINSTYFSVDKNYSIGLSFTNALTIDGISVWFIVLTALIFPLCFLSIWNITKNIKELLVSLQLLEVLTFIVFMVQDIFLFYIFFEIILIPMFYIIINWGPNDRKVKAAFYFFIYTFIGSILLLFAIFFIYNEVGSTNFNVIFTHTFSTKKQVCLVSLLFFSFAIKIPMFPFHLWLPEAHVEAPTVGSVILAALLLKLGSYGIIRLVIPIGIHGISYLKPMIFMLCLISMVYASFMAIRQIDLKRIIAYSSIAHMNLSLLGIFTLNIYGLAGGVILMIAHGVTSAALFLSIGIMYDRYHTRLLKYYSGIVSTMPIFISSFFFFNSANFSIPGTFNFIGEFLTLLSLSESNSFLILIMSTFTSIFGLAYSLLLVNKISFGTLKINFIKTFKDITRLEGIYLLILILIIIIAGLFPTYIFSVIESSLSLLLPLVQLPTKTYTDTPAFYVFLLKMYNSENLGNINFLNFWIAEANIRIPIDTWSEWNFMSLVYKNMLEQNIFRSDEEIFVTRYIASENMTRWVYTECILFLFNTPPSGIRLLFETANQYINISAVDPIVFNKWVDCKIYNRAISRTFAPVSFDYFTIQTSLLEQSTKVLENLIHNNICENLRSAMFKDYFYRFETLSDWNFVIGPRADLIDDNFICTPAGCFIPEV